ncbi:iron complex transport system substrate-binding protein [Methanomicrobium sp. W14]|uniref:ABC transporter substrate-binding protein n=1 Tax=Methanomicrobium sp. W14 TaxID=2817839 RepID=UPI001AE99E1C|nr:ABC transporter substrate-binding protein [Methanomicrobium sp. W14]MBP2134395.1 iron complex transport system substrate-binding protein [Methanomicrobium sp. W14]
MTGFENTLTFFKTGLILLATSVILAATVATSGCTAAGGGYSYSGDVNSSVSINDSYGREVIIPSELDTIVCSSGGTCTRYITYLDSSDKIIGIESGEDETETSRPYTLVNPRFSDLPVISTRGDGTNLEQVMLLNPQVIFMAGNSVMNESGQTTSSADIMQQKTNIPVVAFSPGSFRDDEGLEEMFSGLRVLGEALSKEDRAEELISYIKSCKDDLQERTANLSESERKTAYIGGLSFGGAHGLMSTSSQYVPLSWCNVENIANITDMYSTEFSKESLLYADPDYIFIDAGTLGVEDEIGGFQDIKSAAFSDMKAVQNGDVYATLPYNYRATNYATVIADAYFIGKTVYPERFSDVDPEEKANEIFTEFVGEPVFDRLNTICNNQGFEKVSLK